MLTQVQTAVLEIGFTFGQVAARALSISAGYTGSLMLLAMNWKFPTPFTLTVSGVPFAVSMNSLVLTTLGVGGRERLRKYLQLSNVVSAHTVMLPVYPAYNAIFVSLEGNTQLMFVLLLPLTKHTFKHITVRACRDYEELLNATPASLDFFDALYMTKCMQSAATLAVGAAIIVVDMAENYVVVRRLAQQIQMLNAVRDRADARLNSNTEQTSREAFPWAAEIMNKTENCDRRCKRWVACRRCKLKTELKLW